MLNSKASKGVALAAVCLLGISLAIAGMTALGSAAATAEDLDAMAPGPYRSFVICVTGRALMGADDFVTACRVEHDDFVAWADEQGLTNDERARAVALMEVKAQDLARCRNALAHGGRWGNNPPIETVTELCLKSKPGVGRYVPNPQEDRPTNINPPHHENLRDNTSAMVLSYECGLQHTHSPANGRDMTSFCSTVKQEYEMATKAISADSDAFWSDFRNNGNYEYYSRLEGYECGLHFRTGARFVVTLPDYCLIADKIHDEAIKTHWNSVLQTPDASE